MTQTIPPNIWTPLANLDGTDFLEVQQSDIHLLRGVLTVADESLIPVDWSPDGHEKRGIHGSLRFSIEKNNGQRGLHFLSMGSEAEYRGLLVTHLHKGERVRLEFMVNHDKPVVVSLFHLTLTPQVAGQTLGFHTGGYRGREAQKRRLSQM